MAQPTHDPKPLIESDTPQELTLQFARRDVDRFDGVQYLERSTGPGLAEAVAWLDCELNDEHDAGDHTIVVARVVAIEANQDATPLVFLRGAYGTFASNRHPSN